MPLQKYSLDLHVRISNFVPSFEPQICPEEELHLIVNLLIIIS